MSTFQERLIYLRKEKNLTQKELAKKIGVSDSAISLWELGTNEPKISYLYLLAIFFDVSADYLLGLKEY